MRKLLLTLLALLLPTVAVSQQAFVTKPYSVTSNNNVSTTIAVTNTFQSLWLASNVRTGCTIVNYGSNTMWVFFGPIASATKATSIQLAVNQAVYCTLGDIVLNTQVSITGTATEAFYAAQQ